MITDVSDLEPLLGRFHSGLILVGPLISTYRYLDTAGNASNVFDPDLIVVGPLSFDIAGNASKVYEIVNLGFGKVGTNARGQRAEFIKKLEIRFAEVMTFGSHLEMAHAVHDYWPNEETARVLALAMRAAKSDPTEVAGSHESIDDRSSMSVMRRDYGKQFVDARDPINDTKDTEAGSEYPIQQLGNPAEMQRHSVPSQHEIASADLLERSVQLKEMPKPLLVGARTFAPVTLRSFVVGATVAFVVCLLPVNRDYVPLPAAPAASPSVHDQQVEAKEPTPRESAFLTEPQPMLSSPSQVAGTQAGSGPLPTPVQGSGAVMPPDAREIAFLVDHATDFFAQGDYASARPLLRRAAEAGSANAALMLGATFDPLVVRPSGGFGIKPDTAMARQWYEKAVKLGSDAAAQQLARLARTGE